MHGLRFFCCAAPEEPTHGSGPPSPNPNKQATGKVQHAASSVLKSLDKQSKSSTSFDKVSCSLRSTDTEFLHIVTSILRSLSNLPGSPSDQLGGTASLLVSSLGVGVASIHVLLEEQDSIVPVCVACAGDAAGTDAIQPVAEEAGSGNTSFDWVLQKQEGLVRFIDQSTKEQAKSLLPQDWQELRKEAGYNAFAINPIVRGGKIQGAISIAASRAEAWDETSILHSLSAVALFLSSLLSSPQLLHLCVTLAGALRATDVEGLAEALSMGLKDHFKAVLNMKLHARVALLVGSESCIIFEHQNSAPVLHSKQKAAEPVGSYPESVHGTFSTDEVQAKLKALRKSSAVTSLDDFRCLATAISMNEEHRSMFARQASHHALASPTMGSPKQSGVLRMEEPRTNKQRSLPATRPQSSDLIQSTSSIRDTSEPTELEDMLLHMVHSDAEPATVFQSVHSISNMAGTLVASVLSQDGLEKGTWIADLTAYMQQPGKPARDISLSANAPPLASLVLACMPLAAPDDANPSVRGSCSSLLTAFRAVEAGLPLSPRTTAPVLAIYLTSPTTLSALQLQVVLKELQSVLRVLSKPLTTHLTGELHLSWTLLKSRLLEEQQQVPPKSRFAATKGLAHQMVSQSHSVVLGSGKSVSESASLMKTRKSMTMISSKTSGIAGPRSQTVYSSEPVKTQVAPLAVGLQDKLHKLLVESSLNHCFNRHEDLKYVRADKMIARGGFGSVYRGLWQGLDVAIKVVPHRTESVDSAREAIELAVMTTVSHPNILQIQNSWTDTLVVDTPLKPGEQRTNGLLQLQSDLPQVAATAAAVESVGKVSLETRITAVVEQSGAIRTPSSSGAERCMVIVTELCDHGSLDKAIQKGVFFIQSSNSRIPRLNIVAVLTTLLEISMALRHMHSMQLVHCDLKPGNVLLKSSTSDLRRFTSKLCDFGLVRIHQEATDLLERARRSTFTGTVTHSPPEVLRGDPNPSFAHDVYAFGIMMFEMSTTKGVYHGLNDRQVAEQVVWNQLRPVFPRGFHPQYKELAEACWAADPAKRPSMDEIVSTVGSMLMDVRDRFMPFSPPSPSAPS